MTQYQIHGLLKFAEEDIYDEGCQPETASTFQVDVDFRGDTPQEVIQKVADFLGVDQDGIERNACDEPGRVDFSLMEDAEGTTASQAQIESWKKGKTRLWAVTYTAHVEKVEPVTLEA